MPFGSDTFVAPSNNILDRDLNLSLSTKKGRRGVESPVEICTASFGQTDVAA